MNQNNPVYYLSEHFQSIQGEGNYSGVNSLFIRFHFCNLTCSWCDTKYTWLLAHSPEMEKTADELKEIIKKSPSHHIILTGGEPSLYRLDKLVIPDKMYHVETNGTIIPEEALQIQFKSANITREAMDIDVIKDFNWVVSPKLSNARQKINDRSLTYWVNSNFCIFKFIIRNLLDLEEVEETQQKYAINNNKIYICLEGQTPESQIQPQLVEEIIKRGYNFSPRLHVLLWGDKRLK